MSEPRLVYYDGTKGPEVRVTLRDTLRAALFTAEKPIKQLPPGDASDLLAPQIGGGAFHPCLEVSEAGQKFGRDIEAMASAGEALVVPFQPKQPSDAPPVRYLVLDPSTVKRLRASAEAAPEPSQQPATTGSKKGKATK